MSTSEYNKQYYEKNKIKIIQQATVRSKKWDKENRDRKNELSRLERLRNADVVRLRAKKSRLKLKSEVMNAYGGECVCCHIKELEFLTIDHINGGGRKHRSELKSGSGDLYRFLRDNNFPDDYQVLCWNCNASKHFGGICYHKRLIEQ